MSALLVGAGAVLLWPLLAKRHGRGVALATLVALVFGTVAYGLARRASWEGAAAFALSALLVRLAWGRLDAAGAGLAGAPRILWLMAIAFVVGVFLARDAGPADVLDGLFSSWSGLLFWSPVLWLGLWGCLRARSDGRADPLGPVVLAATVLAALTADFGPYRGARFAPVLPLLALGLGRAFEALRGLALRRPLVPVAAGIAALVAWNGLLMAQYRDGRIPRDDTVSFPRVARNAAATVSAGVGSPTAWPANWIFAARHGVSPARYDVLAGVDLFTLPGGGGRRPGLGGVVDIGHLPTDEALLGDGWSVRHPCGDGVCRAVDGSAELVAPISEPRDADVTIVAAGTGPLTMTLNGVPVLVAPLSPDLRAHGVRLPRARLRRGMNLIALAVAPGDQVLVDRIVFASVDGPR